MVSENDLEPIKIFESINADGYGRSLIGTLDMETRQLIDIKYYRIVCGAPILQKHVKGAQEIQNFWARQLKKMVRW